jgi:hypothetical protein
MNLPCLWTFVHSDPGLCSTVRAGTDSDAKVVLQLPVLTANVKHFGAVAGLEIEAFIP